MLENGVNASTPSQSHLVPSNPTLKSFDPSRQTRIMENLKAAVLLRLANSHPNKALSAAQIAAVERGLAQAFPSFRTPTHPTYASMIQTAILKLNEEGGSMESSISEYIIANYEDLPWAHKSYLSHYLNKLIESGEIVCTSTKCYTLPDLIRQSKSKKKPVRPNPVRKREEDVTAEGNLGGQELILVNEDEVCFQEEETQVFVRTRAKRRRSLVVHHKDEKVGEKDVGREGNMIRSNQRAVIEEQNKLSELNQGDELGKDSELRQHGFGTNDKCNDTVIVEEGLPKTQQGVGCGGGIEQLAGSTELTVENLMPEHGQDEMMTEVLPLDHDSSKQRTGPLLPPVPSVLEKTLPGECKNEAGTKTLQLDSESCDANLVPVPIESVKNSALEERNHSGSSAQLVLSSNGGNQCWTTSDVDGNAFENTLKQAITLERDQSSCAAHWMIVPFKGDTSTPAAQKEMKPVSKERKEIIVCGLPSGVSMQPIRKPQLRRPKKRLKHCQKKSLLLLEKSVPASPISLERPKLLEYEHIAKVSPHTGHETKALLSSTKLKKSPLQTGEAHSSYPHETTPVIFVEESSLQLELEKRKLHLELSPASGPQELMSTDDEDLNIPLQQVKQKCGKQRKLSEGITASKAPVALLSPVGAKLDAEPPASENTAVPQRNNKLIRSKGKKQGKQLKSRLRSQGQKCENLEADNPGACKSEVLSSFQFKGGCDNEKERHDDEDPELMAEIVSLDAQCHELGEKHLTMRDHGLSAEVEQASEVSLRESSPPWNQDRQKEERMQQNQTEMVDVASSDPEPITAASIEEKGSAENEKPQFMEKKIKRLTGQVRGTLETRPAPDHVTAKLSSSAGLLPNLTVEAPAMVCQLDQNKCEQPKNDDQIASSDFEATSTRGVVSDNSPSQQLINEQFSAKLGSQCQDGHMEDKQGQEESEAGLMDPHPPFTGPLKSECGGRPKKQKEETKDGSDSLNLQHQEQEAPAKSASEHALSRQQNKGPKKDGRGRPRKQKQEIKNASDPLNLQQQEQAPAESASLHLLYHRQNKWPKKDGRGRPRKQKEEKKDVAAPLNEHDQLQKASPEAAIQLIENDGHGSPRKQTEETTRNLAAPLNSHVQKKGGSSEIAIHQSSLHQSKEKKRDGRGRPRKQNIVINKDGVAPLNLHFQEQEGLFRLAAHQHFQQQSKQPKRDGRGRPRKQHQMVNEDMTASLSLRHQQQEELSEPETHQYSQLQIKQAVGDGLLQKKRGATEDDAAVVVPLDQWLQEGSPESAVQQNKQPRTDGRGRPGKQDRGTKEDVGVPLNLDRQQKEGLSGPATHQMQNKKRKRDGRGSPLKKDAVTKEDVAAASTLDHEQLEGPSGLATQQLNRQPKRDRRGRPRKLKGEIKENEATLLHQQQELPMLAIHSALGASVVADELDRKEEGKPKETDHHINLPYSEIPLSFDNQSNQMPSEQKHVQGDSCKPEAAGTLLESQTPQQCEEGVLNSTPARVITEDESPQQEKENKPHLEEDQLNYSDEQPGKSQYQVHEMPSDQEQVTLSSASETPKQLMEHNEDRGGQLPRSKPQSEPSVEQACRQEEEQCQLHQENQAQSRDQGKTPKQKSAKTKAIEVPLASKGVLRSRIKRQAQSET